MGLQFINSILLDSNLFTTPHNRSDVVKNQQTDTQFRKSEETNTATNWVSLFEGQNLFPLRLQICRTNFYSRVTHIRSVL